VKRNDGETDQLLKLIVGLVVVVAATCLGWAVANAPVGKQFLTYAATGVVLAVAAGGPSFKIRIRSQNMYLSSMSAAVVLSAALLPPQWAIICIAAGAGVVNVATRLQPIKATFNVAKDVIAATAAIAVAHAAGPVPLTPEASVSWHWLALVPSLTAAAIVYWLFDDGISAPVIALATGSSWRQVITSGLDIRLLSRLGSFVVALATTALAALEPLLVLGMPVAVWTIHLTSSSRMRARLERESWQKLAQTTDELSVVDIDAVVRSAATRAPHLFSADEVEIELFGAGRLVRGTAEQVSFDGPTAEAPPNRHWSITAPLRGHGDTVNIGEIRLMLRKKIKLSEAEEWKLKTFASALCTAIRNAEAYAELGRLAAEHAHDATHDALTGLANRRQLMDRGNQVLAGQRTDGVTALLLIDLNHFKEVNDTLGHGAGDRVLIQIGERLKRAAHNGDLVARLGGDEFAILLTSLSAPAVATHRAEGLLRALHEPMDVDGMRISVEASGGIAAAPSTGGMPEILRRADVAMYQAKRSGRRVTTYSKTRDTADVGRLTLGGDLSRAMAEHEFTVNFQPIVDLGTGQVVAAEALARWHHPEQGTIDPLRFLETVERSELLPAFAEAVLDQSLIAAGTWREAGFDLPVAVNVSPRSLLDARFPGAVMARLRAHDLPPDKLILELTETLTISQLEVVDRVLGRLRDEGVRLALDDFGTGYSSLSVLSRIPVNQLKIDREFVTSMETSPEATAVIRSTVDLARSLDLAVVAEGVESEPQRLALWEMGCGAGQGHLFARPMAAPRLLAALHRGSGGRPGTLAPPLHEEGSVIRFSPRGRPEARSRTGRLPHSHP
jgi:diguanylate cyclase